MEKSALVYIGLTLITVLLGMFVDNREYVPLRIRGGRRAGEPAGIDRRCARNRVAGFAVYCLLAGVSACRIAVGNDYWVYRDSFKLIAQNRYVSYETGFNVIVGWIQKLFGYDHYLPVFGFFSLVTVLFFVKALRDQGSYYAFSLYLLLTGGYYFNSLNSVRYYLALAIALYSMKYVLRGDWGKFVLLILLGAMFHKSILLVIPVYLAAGFLASRKLKGRYYVLGGILAVSLILCRNLYREIIFYFYPYYRNSGFDNGQISYANILKCVCVLALGLVFGRKSLKEDRMNRFYFFLNIFALLVYCCGSFIPEVSRVGYYMIVSQVFLLPRLVMGIESRPLRKIACAGVAGAFGAYFILLLRQMYAVDIRLLPYLNWIFN